MAAKNEFRKHNIFYRIVRPIIVIVCRIVLNYRYKLAPKIDGTYLIVANHVTEWDPMLVACSFKTPMTFLAGEHTMRMGFLSKLIMLFFSTIKRVKGTTDAGATLRLISTLKKGTNVCLFPEGTRTFDGETNKLHPTTGKLIKMTGVTLVTYRISGAYLTTPRWGKGIRRGEMSGEVVNVYDADVLKTMTPDEVTDSINRDIYENAYDTQRNRPVNYKGKRIAEGVERLLYICPKCESIGTVSSKDNQVFCSCGLELTMNKKGFLEGENAPFEELFSWNKWQKEKTIELFENGLTLKDDDFILRRLEEDHTETPICSGTLSMDREFIAIGDKIFPMDRISMDIAGKQQIVFTHDKTNYELCSEKTKNTLKYLVYFNLVKGSRHS